ncbi:MAG: DUF1549 domain-containing protein, partial [Pirellulales bacterium]|nr:DUF1549 domain-containing protein [Pirellulales bacterium]
MNSRFAMIIALVVLTAAHLSAEDGIAFFEKQIRPILVEHCYPCHSAETDLSGGLALDTRAGIEAGGDSGAALVKGNPDASLLVEVIRYQNRDLQMPPMNKLPDEAIANIEKWVAMGAPDPREGLAATVAGPQGMSIEEGRKFWSFQPVTRPPVPKLESPWVRGAIDAFILADLIDNQLSPAPQADKRTLIRRVTQDLTGLPPTPRQIEAFLADRSPDAFERVVQRLLNSPHYGVRWGRHW